MKQVMMLAAILFYLTCSLQAQISNPKLSTSTTKTDTIKREALKIKSENTYSRPPAPQPDLRISTLSFSFVSSQVVDGVTTHTFQINYTVKNEGSLTIAANKVQLQGYISFTGTNPRTIPACGRVLSSLAGEMIPPGASYTGWFRCNASFDKNNPPLYKLYIDPDNTVKESNEENNSAQMTILF